MKILKNLNVTNKHDISFSVNNNEIDFTKVNIHVTIVLDGKKRFEGNSLHDAPYRNQTDGFSFRLSQKHTTAVVVIETYDEGCDLTKIIVTAV